MSNTILRGSLAGAALLCLGGIVIAQEGAAPYVPPPQNYCTANANTSGRTAVMGWLGTAEVSRNDFTLFVSGAPPRAMGIFICGPEAQRLPFGRGFLCIGERPIKLDPPQVVSRRGHAMLRIDLRDDFQGGMFPPGTSCNFQFVYRDGRLNNASDGLRVHFVR